MGKLMSTTSLVQIKTIFVCSILSKMELRFDIQILLICLWNFASTLASDVGADLWGIEQRRDAGFSSANLLCSSCKDLSQFGLNALEPSCSKCCQDDTGGNVAAKKYAAARLVHQERKGRLFPDSDDQIPAWRGPRLETPR